MADLPKGIQRRCCSGKLCTTRLWLVDNSSPVGWPLLYAYERDNGNRYTDWLTEQEMFEWLEQTKEDLETDRTVHTGAA